MTPAQDAHYKDGYKVPEGGDYIVRPVDPVKGNSQYADHLLIRVVDDRIIGRYCSRAAACKRAQQMGGNTPQSRRAAWRGSVRGLSTEEQSHASSKGLDTLIRHEKEAADKEMHQEFCELLAARERVRVCGEVLATEQAERAVDEQMKTMHITRLSEIVSENKLLADDARFATPAMKKDLRQYSLGATRLRSYIGNPYIAANAYRLAHVEAAWLALSERKRITRCRQNFLLWRFLNEDHSALTPLQQYEVEAIKATLRLYPVAR